jgi:hypothetical protein
VDSNGRGVDLARIPRHRRQHPRARPFGEHLGPLHTHGDVTLPHCSPSGLELAGPHGQAPAFGSSHGHEARWDRRGHAKQADADVRLVHAPIGRGVGPELAHEWRHADARHRLACAHSTIGEPETGAVEPATVGHFPGPRAARDHSIAPLWGLTRHTIPIDHRPSSLHEHDLRDGSRSCTDTPKFGSPHSTSSPQETSSAGRSTFKLRLAHPVCHGSPTRRASARMTLGSAPPHRFAAAAHSRRSGRRR